MGQMNLTCDHYFKHRKGKCELPRLDDDDRCFWHKEADGKDVRDKEMRACRFLQEAYLVGANLDRADFTESNLDYADLRGASLWRTKLDGTSLAHTNFKNADLFNAVIENSLYLSGAHLDKIEVNERNGDNKRRSKPKGYLEYLDPYSRALGVNRDLKTYFRSVGLYNRSGQHYVRERVIEGKRLWIAPQITSENDFRWHFPEYGYGKSRSWRALLFLKTRFRWFTNKFLYYTTQYGESPARVLGCYVLISVLCSLVYWIGDGITRNSAESGFSSLPVSYWESLYFSIVTFTTLGFGDYEPNGRAFQFLAASEAFAGAFLLAYFVVVVSRKMMR